MGDLDGFGMVGAEVLDFTLKHGVILFDQCPINEVGELHTFS